MNKYNLGIIGAGMYGKVLMKYFKQDGRANILWVNSASEATTKAAAQEFGVEKWSTDYREVLDLLQKYFLATDFTDFHG